MSASQSAQPAIAALVCLVVACVSLNADSKTVVTHGSYEDLVQGTPGDSGANLYVSKNGNVQVVNQWDLNRDGHVDILISNDHDVFETVDAFIYWGDEQKGYRSLFPDLWRRRPLAQVAFQLMDNQDHITRLPAFGGGRSIVADLNRDGYPEVVFCNFIHNYPGLRTAYVYWGSSDGYAPSKRTELPTNWASGVAADDLNGDGYPELIFANRGVEPGSDKFTPYVEPVSYIYWNSATGFRLENRSDVRTPGARDVAAGRLNEDDFPDLAFVSDGPGGGELKIFFGNGDAAYSDQQSRSIPVPQPTSVGAFDVNGDDYDDLLVTGGSADQTIAVGDVGGDATDTNSVVWLYPGSKTGPAAATISLPSYEANDSLAADLNADGHQDIVIANTLHGKKATIDSFIYWGSAQGFSPDRRSELPTLGANAVQAADLNDDSFLDLVFANSNDGQTYDVPSYIYWGSATGYADYLKSELQSFGAVSVNLADLNRDGSTEILFVNQYSGKVSGQVGSHIFWGNPHHHYSTGSMTSLPTRGAYDTTVADLNDDGFNDIVISNSYISESYIYWGSEDGFSKEDRQEIDLGGGTITGNAADLNRDGHLDLVFVGSAGDHSRATLLWGAAEGFSIENSTLLSIDEDRSLGNVVADLNHDGHLDLVFSGDYFGTVTIFWGSASGYSEANRWSRFVSGGSVKLADLNRDGQLDFVISGSFDPKKKSRDTKTRIFWGAPDGTPSPRPAFELEGYQSIECGIADLNRDGNLDLALSNYMSESTRALPLFIYWGGDDASFSDARRTELPADSSAGIQTVDLNRDGFREIIVHNHLRDGNHSIDSAIYWNGPDGFSRQRRTMLPTFGPHFSQAVDPGNLYTRKLEEEYVSPAVEIPAGQRPAELRWHSDEPHGAKLRFQVRLARSRETLEQENWRGPSGRDTYFEVSGTSLPTDWAGRWLQYRAVFESPDGGVWPILDEVSVVMIVSAP
jgi:hypothetical protein